MNVIVVDDERLILNTETAVIKRVLPDEDVNSFQNAKDAIEFGRNNKVDIAFLDINMKGMSGLDLAKKLQAFNPKINIIFCTGYAEYSLDAHALYCSAYLMKPITEETLRKAIDNLRFQISKKLQRLYIRCFGNFGVYGDGEPVKFQNKKTKELLAYLIDKQGALMSTDDIMDILFKEDKHESYVRNIRSDLINTFKKYGMDDALVHEGKDIGLNMSKIDCDYYEYLDGYTELFHGEYMTQYSFGEETLSRLLKDII